MADNTTQIEQAQAFHEAGFRVMALHTVTKNGCTCHKGADCLAPGKHPVTIKWQSTPLWSEQAFEEVFSMAMTTGYGVICDGLLVVDVDARNGGVASLEKLVADYPAIAGAGLVVETGSGGGSRHYYFSHSGGSLLGKLDQYPGVDFKSGGFVVGPGSIHASGKAYVATVGTPDDIEPAPEALIAAMTRPEYHRTEYNGAAVDVSESDLAGMLGVLDPDESYSDWIAIGMALHHSTGGDGFALWDSWSQRGNKYDGGLQKRWAGFGKTANPVTIATIIHLAQNAGWIAPVTFESEIDFGDVAGDNIPSTPCELLDVSGVDLCQPPGFVGEVVAWINLRCRHPRENLAVGAAISAIGNIIGLSHIDERDGVTANMFVLCVGGSRTGKESVLQAQILLQKAAGIAPASHGAIKSEQELVRNLVDHQASFYAVDEIGIFLQKLKNAQEKGSASYLEGVIGMLMSAYSKADGIMQITGDLRKEVAKAIIRDIAGLNKLADAGETGLDDIIAAMTRRLNGLDQGLEKPFLSLIGYTTPVTFSNLVDYHAATSGFIGRAMIFSEPNTAPRAKRNFRQGLALPDRLATMLVDLQNGGVFAIGKGQGRVEHYGDRVKVPTAPEASTMLDSVLDHFEAFAAQQKDKTGLEALAMGAYELVSKVSFILAAPGGIRTPEHVRWAFALVDRDVKDKMVQVVANSDNGDQTIGARLLILMADGRPAMIGRLCDRIRKYKPADIKRVLDRLVAIGDVVETETGRSHKGKPVITYHLPIA